MNLPRSLATTLCIATLWSTSAVAQTVEYDSFYGWTTWTYDDGGDYVNSQGSYGVFYVRDAATQPADPTSLTFRAPFGTTVDSFRPAKEAISIEGRSDVRLEGGSVRSTVRPAIRLADAASLDMTGGQITVQGEAGIRAFGASIVRVSGGAMQMQPWFDPGHAPAIVLSDNAQLVVSGGSFSTGANILVAGGNSRLTVSGGTFDKHFNFYREGFYNYGGYVVAAESTARVNIFGGHHTSVGGGFSSTGQSIVNVYGGNFDFPPLTPIDGFSYRGGFGFLTSQNGRINVFGTAITLDGVPIVSGMIPNEGRLAGTLRDGTPFSTMARGRVFVNPVPEPATLLPAIIFGISLAWSFHREARS